MYDWSAGDKDPKGGKREPRKVPDTQGALSHVKNGPLLASPYPPQVLTSIICCMNYYTRFHLVPAAISMALNLFSMQKIVFSAENLQQYPTILGIIFHLFALAYRWYNLPLHIFWLLLIFTFLQSHWPFFPSWNLHVHSCLWAFALVFLLFYLSSFFSSSLCSGGPLVKKKFWPQFNVLFCVFNNKNQFPKWSPVFIFFLYNWNTISWRQETCSSYTTISPHCLSHNRYKC